MLALSPSDDGFLFSCTKKDELYIGHSEDSDREQRKAFYAYGLIGRNRGKWKCKEKIIKSLIRQNLPFVVFLTYINVSWIELSTDFCEKAWIADL